MQYLDFDLELRGAQGAYEVAARSDEGEVRETFQLTLSDADRAAAGKLTGGGISATMRRIGRILFDALFVGAVRGRYGASRTAARNAGKALRIRLLVQPPELAAIPWELLYDPDEGEHICLTRDLPFVRTAPAAHPIQALAADTPLKVLAMAASPNGMVPIGIEAERARLEQSLAPLIASKRVALTWVEGQTWRALQTALQGGPWHIFHFLGHGGYDAAAQEGFIALADEQSDMVPLGEAQISRLLANSGALRLVVLVACGEADGGDEPFAGIASTLIRRGLPAALAMQRPISTEAAPELTRSFYGALAQGLGVDQALVEARVAISMVPSSAEWATPVLFSRAKDGVLFELPASITVAPPPTAPPTPPVVAPQTTTPDPNSPEAKLLALASQPAASVQRPELRRAMAAALGTGDVKLLCDNLSARIGQRVGVEDLGGETKELIILNLIQYLDRRGLIQALLDELKAR